MNAMTSPLDQALNYAARSVLDVTPALLPRPTPCRGWNLDMLLRHASESLAALHDGTVAGHVGLIPAAPDRGPAADPARTFQDQAGSSPHGPPPAAGGRYSASATSRSPPSPWNAPEPSRSPCTDGTYPRHAASAGRSRTRWPPPCWRSPRCSSPKPAGAPCSARRSGAAAQASPGDRLVAFLGRKPPASSLRLDHPAST